MSARAGSEQQRAALKAATGHALRLAGGAASAQHVTRVSETVLTRYANATHDDMQVPADVALDLDLYVGEPVIARALAQAQGFRLAPPAPDADPASAAASAFLAGLSGLSRENADLVTAICDGLADGKLSETELRRIETEALELQSRVAATLKAVAAARGERSDA